jgi:aminopeptidase N
MLIHLVQSTLASVLSASPMPLGLSEREAKGRALQVSALSYEVELKFHKSEPSFQTRTSLTFNWKQQPTPLFLDLEGAKVKRLSINGASIERVKHEERKLWLESKYLKPGKNQVSIETLHQARTDGEGLHWFKDPLDQKIYRYSHFEPFRAHWAFPCFDQPDLKATFDITLQSDQGDMLLSNGVPLAEESLPDHQKRVRFKKTKPLSTYMLAFLAGPYFVFKDTSFRYPLQLFVRESLAPKLKPDVEEWFAITKKGFDFYESFFGFPYPFEKYDQILVPQFNMGAMENVAAVTFTEKLVYQGTVAESRRIDRADTILHELAHMWFGNLVTMKWWDNLWLNESFATLMAALALPSSFTSNFKTQLHFFSRMKSMGYEEDLWVTQHPIRGSARDTEEAQARFDGITYGKGAAVLRQLRFFLGPDVFQKSIQAFLKAYAFQTWTFQDFLQQLEKTSKKDLKEWSSLWLDEAGTNVLHLEKKDAAFTIHQEAPQITGSAFRNTLRTHRFEIRRFKGDQLQLPESISLTGNSLVLASQAEPTEGILLNMGLEADEGFFFVNWQEDEVKALKTWVQDRPPFWQEEANIRWISLYQIWHMVRRNQFGLKPYWNLSLEALSSEKEANIVSALLKTLLERTPFSPSIQHYYPTTHRKALDKVFEKQFLKLLKQSSPGDLPRIWLTAWLSVVREPGALTLVKEALQKGHFLEKVKLDNELRWSFVQTLAKLQDPEARVWIQRQLKLDPSHYGEEQATQALASIPEKRNLMEWLEKIEKGVEPFSTLRAAMQGIQSSQSPLPVRLIRTRYFEFLKKEIQKSDPLREPLIQAYAEMLFPASFELEDAARTLSFLKAHPGMPETIKQTLQLRRQQIQTCLAIREKNQG